MAKKTKKLTEEQLVTHARTQFESAVKFNDDTGTTKEWEEDANLYDSRYSAEERKRSDVLVGQGRMFIPKTYSHIQRILVDVLDTYFFDKEEIINISSWHTIPAETRLIVKNLLNYRLNGNPINFYYEAFEAVLDAMKAKVGIMKVYPRTVNGKYFPKIETLPYEDVFFSPSATWKDYWNYPIIHRMIKSLDYLKRRKYKNLKMIQPITDESLGDPVKEQRAEDKGSPFVADSTIKVQSLDRILIYEIWTFMDVNNDGLLESCSYLMAGDAAGPKVVIRDVEENKLPYKTEGEDYNRCPIVVGQALPEPHKMKGKSLPGVVKDLQRETNVLRNQRREAVALALRKPLLVTRGSGIDLVSLVNRKVGAVVLGDDVSPSSIRELEMRDPTATSVQEQMRTDQDFYETTSIPPNLMGMSSGPDETATSVVRHEENANKKIGQIIRNLSETLFLPAFKLLLRLEQEYCTDDFIKLVTGRTLGWGFARDGNPPRKIIQGDFDLKVTGSMNKQTQINRLLMIMDRANMANQSTMQLLQSGVIDKDNAKFIDTSYIIERLLPLLGEKDLADFLIEAKQPPPTQQGKTAGIASQPSLDALPGPMSMEGMQ